MVLLVSKDFFLFFLLNLDAGRFAFAVLNFGHHMLHETRAVVAGVNNLIKS